LFSKSNIRQLLLNSFSYEPTNCQLSLIDMLAGFILSTERYPLFVLKGYAGTGKTTIVSALVNLLPTLKLNSVLLAPTGKAAKVLANYSKKQAFTIHKKIYRILVSKDGQASFSLHENKHKNTIFIIDEASMISNDSSQADLSLFTARNILDDLIQYVYNGDNCKLLLIGDTAQLPPVKLDISPALDTAYLKRRYDISADTIELDEVVRQSQDSGILENATLLRKIINQSGRQSIKFKTTKSFDFFRINGSELQEALETAYSASGTENSIIICRTNKVANQYNQQIRNRILLRESELSAGDLMMVVKNNYYWLADDSKAGFIANGDSIEIKKIIRYDEIYGFRFAKVVIGMIDYKEEPDLELYILLDTLSSETPALSNEDSKKLYDEIGKDYEHLSSKRERLEKIKSNPFFNALQVKFAYALTCHKSQGGQWNTVFVEQGYLKEEMINNEYFRWLYTAITRASNTLYLVNFSDHFFQLKKPGQ
jgi:ATP-dependent exoDNAse (exonuclease V) alpha subunit